MDELKKPYDPTNVEDAIYKKWEQSGMFDPDNLPGDRREIFSIVLPPPNVTGTLHMGSAFMLAIEDVMVRFNRMMGKKTLWIPGTDHAAIATQSKVEKIIQKEEGKNRHDLGRDELLRRVEMFAKESHDTIVNQIKKMGCSVDWSREAFTLDKKRNFAVNTAFKKMYDGGIIYRGYRTVNWDPKGQTTISDDEIVYEERKATLYTFKYSKEFPIAISTTRLETKVGDTAVAVHPEDARYKQYVGQKFNIADFAGEKLEIEIIADSSVDPEFGTGALGVTPAHSIVDWEISHKHGLPLKQVINEYAKMSVNSPILDGKKTSEAREVVAEWLRNNGLMIEEKEIDQNVSTAERTGGVIEPLPKLQWFVDVNKEFLFPHEHLPGVKKGEKVTLKHLMLSVLENNAIKMIPDRFEKVYINWINNLRDWCISRQIWYGHRIPVWYKPENEDVHVGQKAPENEGWTQDEDTLDTWFSSGLWTFSTLGWPEETSEFKTYHPTTVLETAYDILFFWVARMILMSTYLVGQIPFHTIYLHGLVRDSQGRKISKSLGNNIDPVDVIPKYSADAIRMAMIVGTSPGNDSKVSEEKFKAYKHFANKIWNASRFVLENASEAWEKGLETKNLSETDRKTLDEFNSLVSEITSDMENFRFYLAAEKLYHYFWHTFADIIIESSKKRIKENQDPKSAKALLKILLENQLKLLHPFMPFVTEKIWSILPSKDSLLMIEPWPGKISG